MPRCSATGQVHDLRACTQAISSSGLSRPAALLQVRLLPCDRANTAQRFAEGSSNGTYVSVVSGRCLQMLDNSYPDEGLQVGCRWRAGVQGAHLLHAHICS
jgi:hypothetical protein